MSTYYGLVMPQVYTGGVYIRSIRQTKETDESGGVNEITATLTNRQTEVFRIKNGVSAGFGETTATADTLEPGSEATVDVEATGDNTARNFAFKFGIPRGEPFAIYRTFPDIQSMNADTSVPAGKFVIIVSDVEDEDNAKLFVRTADGYSFITDLSGAQGIKGEQGIQGEKGDKGEQGTLNADNAVTADIADANYAVGVKADGEVTKTLWSKVWEWIKSKLSTVATSGNYTDLSNKPSIPSVPTSIANGGTGKTTANTAMDALMQGTSEMNNPNDNEYILAQRQNNGTCSKYTLAKIWDWIKNKISSVLGLTETSLTTNDLKIKGSIFSVGSKVTVAIIKMKDNTADAYGNGIVIGGGGLVVIGSGESQDTFYANAGLNAGSEKMVVTSDGYIKFCSNMQNGYSSRKEMTFDGAGNLTVPNKVSGIIKIPTSQPSTLEDGMIWLA